MHANAGNFPMDHSSETCRTEVLHVCMHMKEKQRNEAGTGIIRTNKALCVLTDEQHTPKGAEVHGPEVHLFANLFQLFH